MTMKKISILILLTLAAGTAGAQKKLSYKPPFVAWENKPSIHPVPPEYQYEPAIILQQDLSLDYRYEGRDINVYYTFHKTVKVLNDKGIEWFNKIAIPVAFGTRVPSIKARTILPNGTVKNIEKDMIKVTKNEYGENVVVFAMEGVEKNAEIELLLSEIRPLSFFGNEYFQFPIPVLSSRFEIYYPKDMIFEERGYNGFPQAREIAEHNRKHVLVTMADIPALQPEAHSFYDLYRMRVEYRVHNFVNANDYDKERPRIFTWTDFGKRIFNNYYNISRKERAAVNRYLMELGVRPYGNEAENIRKIEDGIKKDIVLYPNMDESEAAVLDSIISRKSATSKGMIRLMAACFTQAGVKHELGMAGNRHEHRFDNTFDNWGNMDEYVFYFPGQKKFLSPTSVYLRYPLVPDELLNNNGIFCTIPPKWDITDMQYEVKKITPPPAAQSQRSIAAAVHFAKGMEASVDVSYSFTGYTAAMLRKELLVQPKNKEKDLVREVVGIAAKPEDIVKYTITNEGLENFYTYKPLEITATVNTNRFVEKGGYRYLLRIGDIIGAHDEQYDDKKRVMPVDLDYPQSAAYTITVNIPKGYKIMNQGDLKMHADYVDRDLKAVISFNSDCVLRRDRKNGDKLIITVTESYPKMHFPVTEYNRYRSVVNAAADFNKVALVMTRIELPKPKPKPEPPKVAPPVASNAPAKKHK